MSKAISLAKISFPSLRPDRLDLNRIDNRLNQGLKKQFTLVTAPAGYGKTTFVGSWLKKQQIPTVWISLDTEDNSISQFLAYLYSAINQHRSKDVQKLWKTLSHLDIETYTEDLLTGLILEIEKISEGFVLVFDNYQTIENPEIHKFMEFLLLNLQKKSSTDSDDLIGCHPIILSRSSPPFPLLKWQLDGFVDEISLEEFQLSPKESTQFLKQIASPAFSQAEIASLVEKTDGWIAGLRMAEISSQNSEEKNDFVSGQNILEGNKLISDYLVSEVLEDQTEEVQNFLIKTSILTEMNFSLCNAVVGWPKSQEILEELERNKLFIISLDHQRNRFKYRQLFKAVLQNQQKKLAPEELKQIHIKAAVWYEEHNDIEESFYHWLLADEDKAAQLLIRNAPIMVGRFKGAILQELTSKLPEEVLLRWPWLGIYQAWCTVPQDPQAALVWLGLVEDAIARKKKLGEEIENEDELFGNILALQITQASLEGEREHSIQMLAEEALALLPKQATNVRGLVHKAVAARAHTDFDLDLALNEYLHAVSNLRQRKNLVGAIDSQNMAGEILLIQGNLHQAHKLFREALTFDKSNDQSNIPYFSRSFSLIGLILYEWNQLAEAFETLEYGYTLAKHLEAPLQVEMGTYLVSTYLSNYDIETAGKYFQEIESVKQWKSIYPYIESNLIATKLQYLTMKGDLSEAKRLISTHAIQHQYHEDPYKESESMALAYHHYHLGHMQAAIDLASSLGKYMKAGKRDGRRIKMLVLEAAAQCSLQNQEKAIELINLALEIGQKGTYIRTFVDQGEPILEILVLLFNQYNKIPQPPIDLDYLKSIIDAFLSQRPLEKASKPPANKSASGKKQLIEPLTDSEYKVLRMMSIGLSNKEIARELNISVNTIKTHASHIYQKLAVSNRAQAAHKAKILELI